MAKLSTLLLLPATICWAASAAAQTNTYEISAGPGYAQSGYFKLSDGSSEQVAHDAWDLAFSNLGAQQAGIFFNESTASSMGQPTPSIAVYDPIIFDFAETIDPATLSDDLRLYNPEISWAEGAFNTMRDTANALDFGWGAYDPAEQKVAGSRVFVVKLRNGQYRKVMFDAYDGSTYTFRIANLDGSNPQTKTINTDFGNGSPVVYFSFATGTSVDLPTGWDLVFCRYVTFLFDGTAYLPYNVTGILSNDGILSAKAAGVDPAGVDYQDYLDSLQTRLDVIGHDWKYFSGSVWSVPGDVAYFVKTKEGKLYKIVFTDFTGSSTGTGTFEQTYLGQLSGAADLPADIREVLVYPNPVAERLYVSLVAASAAPVSWQMLNTTGQTVRSGSSSLQDGLNVLEIDGLPALPVGNYFVRVQTPAGQFTREISVGK